MNTSSPVKGKAFVIFALILIFAVAANVFAASQTVYIYQGNGPVQSASIATENGANYQGWNYATSGHSLYIDLQSSTGSGWSNIKTSLMAINSSASGTSTLTGARLWRVQLNPQYYFTDCDGKGTVSSR
jgi:hypothetical protein